MSDTVAEKVQVTAASVFDDGELDLGIGAFGIGIGVVMSEVIQDAGPVFLDSSGKRNQVILYGELFEPGFELSGLFFYSMGVFSSGLYHRRKSAVSV